MKWHFITTFIFELFFNISLSEIFLKVQLFILMMFDITHNSHTYVFQIEHDIELEYLYGNDLLDVYIYYKIIIIISFDNQELLITTREIF